MKLALAIAIVLAACGPGSRGDGDDAPDASMGSGSGSGDASMVECYAGTTDVEVALQVQIEDSCAIWNSLSEMNGTARVTRSGTMLTIDFGNGVVFTGTIATTGAVMLTYVHQHPFTDGCGWEARETMVGQLQQVGCKFVFDYDYVESVVMNNGGCATPCSAMADVSLELTPVIL